MLQHQINSMFDNAFINNKFTKNNVSPKINHYETYSSESIDMVYEMYQKEIDYFKYEYRK